mgnify:CR=1 FL=1
MQKTPIVIHERDIPRTDVANSPGAVIQVLLGPEQDMPRFYTRMFTLAPGASIARHGHDTIEHEQVMLEGRMKLTVGDAVFIVEPGHAMYLPPGVAHSYENVGDTPVRFICCIPSGIPYTTDFF